jgi:peptidoglycan hydrolase CwlO-like protein
MDNWKDIAIGALIAQAIGGGWLYLRSIGNKVSKEDHDKLITALKVEHEKALTELKSEIEKLNAELKNFARQGEVNEVKSDIRRLETKIEAKLDTIQQQLMTLLARRSE